MTTDPVITFFTALFFEPKAIDAFDSCFGPLSQRCPVLVVARGTWETSLFHGNGLMLFIPVSVSLRCIKEGLPMVSQLLETLDENPASLPRLPRI